MQHRSINQRLERCKSINVKHSIITCWIDNWRQEQMQLINQLDLAIDCKDFVETRRLSDKLKIISVKKFSAAPNVVNHIFNIFLKKLRTQIIN